MAEGVKGSVCKGQAVVQGGMARYVAVQVANTQSVWQNVATVLWCGICAGSVQVVRCIRSVYGVVGWHVYKEWACRGAVWWQVAGRINPTKV